VIINACCSGDTEHLLAYESERQRRVVPMMGGIDFLNRLYSNRITPLVLLRNVGCHLTNSMKPVKVHDTVLFCAWQSCPSSR